jgi:hypothetical protein
VNVRVSDKLRLCGGGGRGDGERLLLWPRVRESFNERFRIHGKVIKYERRRLVSEKREVRRTMASIYMCIKTLMQNGSV